MMSQKCWPFTLNPNPFNFCNVTRDRNQFFYVKNSKSKWSVLIVFEEPRHTGVLVASSLLLTNYMYN